MKSKQFVQYTLRQVPVAVDEALRRRSMEEGKSINQTAIEALHAGLVLSGEKIRHHDLDFLIGTWVEDPSFDAAIKAQDQVDPDMWK